jgi:Pyruvate/2-oxoacid:ferredoxin oxidoreductase delta subunit
MEANDPFLEKRVAKYDQWLNKGQISFSSKVIPVSESLQAQKWVLPTEQVLDLLRGAKSVALQKCECRTHYGRCDKPLEVCFLLNEVADKFVEKGRARRISMSEATDVLQKANESGLVHLSLYMPDHEVFALCSCCSCCCHDIRIVKLYGRKDLLVRSEYVAVTDIASCIHCGECVERCAFDARSLSDGEMVYDAAACLGCGLCVTVYPAGATIMLPRES